MKNFNWGTFNINKIAVWCKTEEEARDFCKNLHENGSVWCDEDSTHWGAYGEQTCYDPTGYCDMDWFRKKNYTIIPWSDYMTVPTKSESNSKTTFTKSDLKDGDVILRRRGNVEIAIPSVGVFVSEGGYNLLGRMSEDLTHNHDEGWDIVQVRRPAEPVHCQYNAFEKHYGELVFPVEQIEEMTLEEVCKAFGKKIQIVEGK